MLGEADAAIGRLKPLLQKLKDERELFRLANGESMNEFVFDRKMKEFDARIEAYESEIADWEDTYQELLASESSCVIDEEQSDADDFRHTFDELCRIDGVESRDDAF